MTANRNYTIMLADDDPDDRELFEEAINDKDAAVITFPNGSKLMENLDANGALPDCVFLDLNMPEKSGKECLKEIRADERLKDLPVIIYSTSSSVKDIDDTFALGANLYITKPNSFSDLKKTLKSILSIDWSIHMPNTTRERFVFRS